jgi:aryl-alcohol dehydrogenase
MNTMKAAVLRGHDQPYRIEDVTLGKLEPGEALVRIVSAGMCHTDMLPRDPQLASALGPVILGHEGAGVVEQVGDGVTRVKPGDHVLISFDSCGWCRSCLTGGPAYCAEFEARNLSGRRNDGTASAVSATGTSIANRWFGQSSFAEYAVATERNLVTVDHDLPLELLGPLGCGIQTGAGSVLLEMKLRPGQSIAVFGAGAVGLAAVMAARLAGASDIVVVDLNESRLEVARELGATRVVPGGAADVVDQVTAGGAGLDFSFETTAVSDVISAAISVLGRPGTAVLVGAGSGQLSVWPPLLAGRHVTYAFEGSAVPQVFLPQLIGHWQAGVFPFDRLVRTYPLSEINAAEADSVSGATIKPVLLPTSE